MAASKELAINYRTLYCPRVIINLKGQDQSNLTKQQELELAELQKGKLQFCITNNLEELKSRPEIKMNDEFVTFINEQMKTNRINTLSLMYDSEYYSDEIKKIFNVYGGFFDENVKGYLFNVMIYFYEIKDINTFSREVFVKFGKIFRQVSLIDSNMTQTAVKKYLLTRFLEKSTVSLEMNFRQPPYCKTQLFRYQINTISRLLYIYLNGIKTRITSNLLMKFVKDNYYDFTSNKFINKSEIKQFDIRSGIIADSAGIGKTLQTLIFIIELIVNHQLLDKDEYVLILVPSSDLVLDLKQKWLHEFNKHIDIPIEQFKILIMTYDELSYDLCYSKDKLKNIKMLVIDEFHKFVNISKDLFNTILEFMGTKECKITTRWGITGTPMLVEKREMLYNIICFLTGEKFQNQTIETVNSIQENIQKCFLRSIMMDVIDQTSIPEIEYKRVYLNLGKRLQDIYNTENITSDITKLRRLVNRLSLMLDGDILNSTTLSGFINFIKNHYKTNLDSEKVKLDEINKILEEMKTKKYDDQRLFATEKRKLEYYFDRQKQMVEQAQKAYDYYIQQSNTINKSLTNKPAANDSAANDSAANDSAASVDEDDQEETTCAICMCPYADGIEPITYLMKCGHFFHKGCIDNIVAGTYNSQVSIEILMNKTIICPLCRESHNLKTEIKNIKKVIDMYESPKCHFMKELITTSTNKIIVFTQFPDMISNLVDFIRSFESNCMTLGEYMQIETKDQVKVLILSSIENAEGHDLYEFDHVVIFEPFEDYAYSSAIKEQLVGRIYRIGQTKRTNCTELITLNTIEEKICKQ
jgi:SNF2 family DNA or RNA helicase